MKRMGVKKWITGCIIAVACVISSLPVYASELDLVDYSKKGSLSMELLDVNDNVVPGGTISIYLLAEAQKDKNNNEALFYLEAYDSMTGKLALNDAALSATISSDSSNNLKEAAKFVEFINKSTISATAREKADSKGRVSFIGLKLGLYLVVQKEADVADGYYAMKPFLVTIPGTDANGKWIYDVLGAEPKMQPITKPNTPTPPQNNPSTTTTTTTPPTPTTPIVPSGPLPQTGQLNWPVPVIAIIGLCFMIVGFYIDRKRDLF